MLLKTRELREHTEGSFVDLRLQHDMPGTMSYPRENSAFSSYPTSFLFSPCERDLCVEAE